MTATSTGALPLSEAVPMYVYTPSKVARWIRYWTELCTKAQSPQSSYGLMLPGPTPTSPKVGARQKGFSGDRLGYALIKADMETACQSLSDGLERDVIVWMMFGYTIDGIAEGSRIERASVVDAYNAGTKQMAVILGWVEVVEVEA